MAGRKDLRSFRARASRFLNTNDGAREGVDLVAVYVGTLPAFHYVSLAERRALVVDLMIVERAEFQAFRGPPIGAWLIDANFGLPLTVDDYRAALARVRAKQRRP